VAADEWTARKNSAEEEMATLQKAVDVLNGKFSLLQTKTSLLRKNKNYSQRDQVATILRRLGHKFNSFSMLQAAENAMDDPFVKVRGLIKDMIMHLEEQAAEEASKEGKCKEDLAKGTRDVKVKAGLMKKYQSRLDGASAKFETLGVEVTDLQAEVKQLTIDMQAWTKIRNQENTDNTATIKDAKESIEAINTAIGVLNEFYGAAAFIQAKAKQPQSETASTIIEFLQTAQEDFEKILQETETAETTGAEDYEKDLHAGKVSLAKKNALIDGKTQERAGLKVMVGQVSDDLANATKAWQAATEYLKGKKEECSNKSMSYEERKRRREDEIAGLQEALEILSSDESFVQTGKFMAKHA
jgi:predicted  nucleic acid-binding Zn-ribbon protein